jgi:hypothetical protein
MSKFLRTYYFLIFSTFLCVCFFSVQTAAAMTSLSHVENKETGHSISVKSSFGAKKVCSTSLDIFCDDEKEHWSKGLGDDVGFSFLSEEFAINSLRSSIPLVAKRAKSNFLLEEDTFQKTTTSQ